MTNSSLPVNKGLLDARSTGRTFADLYDNFYPVEFFDACSIIEEMVLRDEIVLVGKFEKLPRSHRQALQPFIDAGVFKLCIASTPILTSTATDPELRRAAQDAIRNGLTSASLEDGDYAVTRLLGAEINLRAPTIPLLQHLHNYQFFRRPVLDHTICDLVARYQDLKDRAEQLKEFDSRRLALKSISVPPIALQVMQRAYTHEQLPRAVLEVRETYRGLRRAMHDLAEIISDPDLSSSRYFDLVGKWEPRWQTLFDIVPGASMQIGTSALPLLSGGLDIAKAYQSGSFVGAVSAGSKLIASVADLRGKLLFRPIHLSVNNYLRTHPQHMVLAVSRIFHKDPRVIRRSMEAVASSGTSVWRQALARFSR